MRTVNLYKYTRKDGGVSVSPKIPLEDYSPMYRLIADSGMTLTDGKSFTPCVDVESVEGWREVSATEEVALLKTELVTVKAELVTVKAENDTLKVKPK